MNFGDVLRELLEKKTKIKIEVNGGGSHPGSIDEVSEDYVTVIQGNNRHYVPISAISCITVTGKLDIGEPSVTRLPI